MNVKKSVLTGISVLTLVFGLLLVGCVTIGTPLKFVETETTQNIYQFATELLSSKGGKISLGELSTGICNKYSGMERSYYSGFGVVVTYNGNTYYINCEYVDALITFVNANTTVVEVTSVKQVEKTE